MIPGGLPHIVFAHTPHHQYRTLPRGISIKPYAPIHHDISPYGMQHLDAYRFNTTVHHPHPPIGLRYHVLVCKPYTTRRLPIMFPGMWCIDTFGVHVGYGLPMLGLVSIGMLSLIPQYLGAYRKHCSQQIPDTINVSPQGVA